MTSMYGDEPLTSSSEQFGLARPRTSRAPADPASPAATRPWGLRGMRRPGACARPLPEFTYCHRLQVAVDASGRPLVVTGAADATANSVTDGDGDEGRSEDWTYDFIPDNPFPV
jgi:putative ATP-grasp target RiPP